MHKKNHIKAFILVLMISICSIFTACGNTNPDYKVNIYDTDIAKFSLFSYSGKNESSYGLINLGHAFVSIENISSEDIILYNFTIPAGVTVAIGTWSLSEHFGIWFNIESNYITNKNKYDGRYSITTGISQEDISTINNFLEDNDRWSILRNCSYFALSFWNEIAEDSEYIEEKAIYTPTYIEKEISKFENYEINKTINTSSTCYYYNGNEYLEFHFEGDE